MAYLRSDVAFDAEGAILRGWLYTPAGDGPFPTVILSHGWGAVKEMFLDLYAEIFAAAGLASLVYDHRNFGASDGEPRQEMDPVAQMRDYKHAVTFAQTLGVVDAQRIGVWGTSYSGGHVLQVAAMDRRVRCVVSQGPTINGWHNTLRRFPAERLAELRADINADRAARQQGEPPRMIPIQPGLKRTPSSEDQFGSFGNDGAAWFGGMRADRLHRWRNEITLRSLDYYGEYEPGAFVERIAPTPLLMITANDDTRTPTDEILATYSRAREPKQLLLLPGGHYDLYGVHLQRGATAAAAWFAQHLSTI